MAMIHQYPLQEISGTTARDAVGSVDATYDGNPALNQAETFSSNPSIKSVLFDPTDTLDNDAVIIPATVNIAHAQGSVFLFFKPASTTSATQFILWLRSLSFGASMPAITISHDVNSASDFSVVFSASADNVTGVTYTYGAAQGFTSQRWLIVGVTWDTSGITFHVYDFDTGTWVHHFDDNSGNGFAWPAGNFESLTAFGPGGTSSSSHVYGSHICLYDTALTDAEVEAETFNPPASALPCSTTFNASELASMRAAAAQIMTCLAEVQEQSLAGKWITIATNVPCNIEISGVRRELDSSDNEVVFQSWLVSLAGTVALPAPTDNKTIRIIVGGLTLQTFQYYQSPDDIVIPLECEEV
jgi:hypothetical protein